MSDCGAYDLSRQLRNNIAQTYFWKYGFWLASIQYKYQCSLTVWALDHGLQCIWPVVIASPLLLVLHREYFKYSLLLSNVRNNFQTLSSWEVTNGK